MSEEEAFRTALSTLKEEKITPFHPEELAVVRSAEKCINCGLCINYCPVVSSVGVDRFSGPRSIAIELSRSTPEFWSASDIVYLCTGCGTCREVCPHDVDVPEITNLVRHRIFEHRPDLVPKALQVVHEIITEHNLAFEPWEDPEDKAASRDMRLDRYGLPLLEDRVVDSADVLYFPGCQAEERAQEVREAAKVIFNHFNVNYTLLDEMSCCGLPAKLIGDNKLYNELGSRLTEKVRKLGVKQIVTTCAGCTSNLLEVSELHHWNLPVYHLVEFLANEIGFEELKKHLKPLRKSIQTKVTMHDPCHLIRHTSREIHDIVLKILDIMPDVTYLPSGVTDSCCGGGGMVSYHSKDVSNAVVKENLEGITSTDAERLVTPCPLCTAQLENSLYRTGSSIEVDDLAVFIAQRLK
jgi:Fe-S oxidoreductase